MKRLGYTRFVAQGGDWGNAVGLAARLRTTRRVPLAAHDIAIIRESDDAIE
jgi:hypothetical protein